MLLQIDDKIKFLIIYQVISLRSSACVFRFKISDILLLIIFLLTRDVIQYDVTQMDTKCPQQEMSHCNKLSLNSEYRLLCWSKSLEANGKMIASLWPRIPEFHTNEQGNRQFDKVRAIWSYIATSSESGFKALTPYQ